MSIKDPDHLLAEEAQDEERRKAVAAARDAPAQRLRRLYRAWHESPGHYTRGVANYSPEHYREELGVLPPTMRAFCLAWAPYLLRLAQTLTADGWWQDVERLCCRDPEDRGRLFTWHVLQAARAADHERVAELLERGNGLGDWFLQYGLYRELWTGAGTERVRPASPEPPAAMAPYSLKPPNWLVCAGKQVQVGASQFELLAFMRGKAEALTEEARGVLTAATFHKTKTVLNQFLARQGFDFHFRAGRDGKFRLVATRYEKPKTSGKPGGKRGKPAGK